MTIRPRLALPLSNRLKVVELLFQHPPDHNTQHKPARLQGGMHHQLHYCFTDLSHSTQSANQPDLRCGWPSCISDRNINVHKSLWQRSLVPSLDETRYCSCSGKTGLRCGTCGAWNHGVVGYHISLTLSRSSSPCGAYDSPLKVSSSILDGSIGPLLHLAAVVASVNAFPHIAVAAVPVMAPACRLCNGTTNNNLG